jgi:hypothetical protein
MWPKVVALALLLLGVALGVVGNWLKPPARMGGRAIVAIFAVLLIFAAGITYLNTGTAHSDSPDHASSDGGTGSSRPSAQPTEVGPAPASSSVSPTGGTQVTRTNEPTPRTTTRAAGAQPVPPAAPPLPCIVGSWALTTIVDYVPYSDQTVTMSYDTGWEKRTYQNDGTFTIANDWHERGYDNTLNELIVHSNGTAEGHYQLTGATATYRPVSSVGNWTLTVNGEVRSQSSVIFSSGEETITCTSSTLKVVSGTDYKASYTRT